MKYLQFLLTSNNYLIPTDVVQFSLFCFVFDILKVVPDEIIFALCEAMIKSGTEYSRRVNSPSPLMYAYYETEYLGKT